jgi:hypothetical protein
MQSFLPLLPETKIRDEEQHTARRSHRKRAKCPSCLPLFGPAMSCPRLSRVTYGTSNRGNHGPIATAKEIVEFCRAFC